jgi:hypothetical protein
MSLSLAQHRAVFPKCNRFIFYMALGVSSISASLLFIAVLWQQEACTYSAVVAVLRHDSSSVTIRLSAAWTSLLLATADAD